MHTIGYYLGISKQTEVLILTLIGICSSILDTSLLELNSNLQQTWATNLDPNKYSVTAQLILKYIASGVIILQAFSVHVYLAFYIVMLWPIVCEDKPSLLLPWLLVGAVKTIITALVTFFLGLFVCVRQGFFRPICADFFLSQIIKNTPSIYTWCNVLSYYKELKQSQLSETSLIEKRNIEELKLELALRRRKARSLTEQKVFGVKTDDGRNLISESTIENLLHRLSSNLNQKTTRSLDTLLKLIAVEAEKEEILNMYDDISIFDENMSITDKTTKLLKLTENDIENAKKSKASRINAVIYDETLDSLLSPRKQLDDYFLASNDKQSTITQVDDLELPQNDYNISEEEISNISTFEANTSKMEDFGREMKSNFISQISKKYLDIDESEKKLKASSEVFGKKSKSNKNFGKEEADDSKNNKKEIQPKKTYGISPRDVFKDDGYTLAYKKNKNDKNSSNKKQKQVKMVEHN